MASETAQLVITSNETPPTIISASIEFCKMSGSSFAALVGQPLSKALMPADGALLGWGGAFPELFMALQSGRSFFSPGMTLKWPSGNSEFVEVRASPLYDEQTGAHRHFLLTFSEPQGRAEVLPDADEVQHSSSLPPAMVEGVRNVAGEVQQLLGRLVRLVLGRMSSQLRLEAVLRHVLDAHTTEALGHFRATIADVFETCRFQTATLEHVTALAKREVHELSEECQREALRGCVHDARPDGGAPRRPTEEYGARAIRAQQAITQATMPDDVRRARLAALATPGAVLHGRPPVRPSIEAPSLSALLGGHGFGSALAEL